MRNVPKLRFKEFNGEWEEKKLENIGKIIGGGTPASTVEEYWNGEIQWFTPTEIGKSKYVTKSIRTITELGLNKSSAKLLPKGTILLSSRATIGEKSIAIREVCTNQGFQSILVNKENNNEFIYYLLDTLKGELIKQSSGSTFLEISGKKLGNILSFIPALQEQQKIADFLSSIDKKISITEEKLDLFKEYKKGIMQKIFNQELRFKDSNGNDYPEWEEKIFKNIFKINQGLQIAISERFLEPSTNRMFYITNEFLRKDSKIKYYIENPPETVMCNKEDILMTRTGNTGEVVTDIDGAFHNNFFKINYNKNNFNKKFICYVLKSTKIQNIILKFAGTSTIPDLNHSDFYKIKSNFPCLEEQEKIADFLSNIDNKIDNLTSELEDLKEFKKGLLQQMFI